MNLDSYLSSSSAPTTNTISGDKWMTTRKRRGSVSEDQVFDFIETYLLEHGTMPTQQVIIDAVGGSHSTIGKYVKEWQKSENNLAINNINVPEQIRDASMRMGAKWWFIAEKQMSKSIKMIQENASREVDQANQNYETYLRECERLESQTEQLEVELEAAEKLLDDKQNEISEVRERLIKAELKIEHDADTIKRLNEEVHRSKDVHSEAVKQVTKIFEQRLQAADAQIEKLSSKQ